MSTSPTTIPATDDTLTASTPQLARIASRTRPVAGRPPPPGVGLPAQPLGSQCAGEPGESE